MPSHTPAANLCVAGEAPALHACGAPPAALTLCEAAAFTGLSTEYLERLWRPGAGPSCFVLPDGGRRYRHEDVLAWLAVWAFTMAAGSAELLGDAPLPAISVPRPEILGR